MCEFYFLGREMCEEPYFLGRFIATWSFLFIPWAGCIYNREVIFQERSGEYTVPTYIWALVAKTLLLIFVAAYVAIPLCLFFTYAFNFSNWLWASTLFWGAVIWVLAGFAVRSRNAAVQYRESITEE